MEAERQKKEEEDRKNEESMVEHMICGKVGGRSVLVVVVVVLMLLLLLLLLFLFPLSTSSHVFFLFFNFLLFFFPSSISRLRSRWLVPHPAEPLPLPIFTEEKLLELREAFERMSTRTCYRPALMWDVKGKLLSPLLFFLFLIIVHSHVLVSI